MVYNELEQGNILSEVRVGLASIAYTDISLRSIWAIYKIRQTPELQYIGKVMRQLEPSVLSRVRAALTSNRP